jgi:hypothetical protein
MNNPLIPADVAGSSVVEGRLFVCKSWKLALLLAAALLCVFGVMAASAAAVTPSPGFTIASLAEPSTFSVADTAHCNPGGDNEFPDCDTYEVTVVNTGTRSTESEVVLSDNVPEGLEIREFRFYWWQEHRPPASSEEEEEQRRIITGDCTATGQQVKCDFPNSLVPDAKLKLEVMTSVEPGAKFEGACPAGYAASKGCVRNEAVVEGGGTATARTEEPVSRANIVNGPQAPFGWESFSFHVYGENGAIDSQAGDHPYELKTTFQFNTKFGTSSQGNENATVPVQEQRDIVVNLPVGLVGSVLAAPQCTFSQLTSFESAARHHPNEHEGGCPPDTIVGYIRTEPSTSSAGINGPLYNMTPERGEPAEFAYLDTLKGIHLLYTRVVPTAKGYVLQSVSPADPQVWFNGVALTFFGVPAQRDETDNQPIPFFTNPTDCLGEEPTATAYVDSWQNPARLNAEGFPVNLEEPQWAKAESKSPPVTGCNVLGFPAEVEDQPTVHESDKPTGINFVIKLPQSETVGVPATPTLKKIVARLPEGLTVDPAAGDGLAACSEAQIGWIGPSHLDFTEAPPACPEASKIGTLELETPLLPAGEKVTGEMFLASQNENPFHATLGAYVVVHDPRLGILIKIAGEFETSPHSGRLTAVFDENPNLPFSILALHFFGGPRAELATPESCGVFTTESELFPYSFPDSGAATLSLNPFVIDEACPGGFAPTFNAGSQNLQAGEYTPFVASFGRSDADQELSGLTLKLPEGLVGKIAGVPLCSEAQIHEIEAGTGGCPEDSQVGTVSAGAGPGPDPLFVPGKAYLTGPYNGGPYGLAVVVPAVAGPYNFGTVVVRQSLRINPQTAQVTDVSDPFPKIIDGIPLRLRRIDVTLNREGFTFNPTSCEKEQFAGTITGSPLGAPTSLNGTIGYATEVGASSSFTTPFQVTNCASLKFEPKVSVTTAAHASKRDGQSLNFKITYPSGAAGGVGHQAWFKEAKFDIPKQLPAELKTIQQACLEQTFESNPAACPAHSIIGHAVVHTQVLSEPLEGPVYFVSYGGQKFPDAVLVLSGDNVNIELTGETFIDNATGVTSATFPDTPDVPFESIEVNLPTGEYSEFGSNLPHESYDFCGRNLKMPTLFKAANGLEIHQETPVTVTGCANTPTPAKELAAALKACHKKHGHKRVVCERAARKAYGAKASRRRK